MIHPIPKPPDDRSRLLPTVLGKIKAGKTRMNWGYMNKLGKLPR
jgi:hypothetical protein